MRVVSTLAAVWNYPVHHKKETLFCCKEIRMIFFYPVFLFLVIKSRQETKGSNCVVVCVCTVVFLSKISGIHTLCRIAVVTCPSWECLGTWAHHLCEYRVHAGQMKFWSEDLLRELPKVSRVVLVLVVDDMPVRLVGLNALRRHNANQLDAWQTLCQYSTTHRTAELQGCVQVSVCLKLTL